FVPGYGRRYPTTPQREHCWRTRMHSPLTPQIDKDAGILALLARLQTDLGANAFDIVDHWEDDLCAIGFGMPSDHTTLVYVSTYGHPDGEYDYELETAPKTEADVYSVAGRGAATTYDRLADIIKKHLRITT
ncbi:MAG: hypothetical protein NXI04_24265, partial [Planctomycetaceae bacterium]|nr:hypothetical protein [Planctomycetaceae bacterium]